jgi:hypothetical protein
MAPFCIATGAPPSRLRAEGMLAPFLFGRLLCRHVALGVPPSRLRAEGVLAPLLLRRMLCRRVLLGGCLASAAPSLLLAAYAGSVV